MRDYTGKKFGRLTVKSFHGKDNFGGGVWLTVCDCGAEKLVSSSNLTGKTRSCGCLKSDVTRARMTTHGKSGTRTHRIWKGIISRCYTPSATGFADYGGRGIRVCARWKNSYGAFLADMGEAPIDCTIERRDVNGDYTAENCVWVPKAAQMLNTRRNVLIGDEATPLVSAKRAPGVTYDSVRARLRRGWAGAAALTTKPNTRTTSRKITVGGRSHTIAEWAASLGMDERSLRLRLSSGWTEEDAVLTPKGGVRLRHSSSCSASPSET